MSKKPRKEPRQLVDIPVEVRTPARLVRGSGRDLTESGIRVRVDGRIPASDRVGVTLRLPGFANMDLNFAADVRWVREENMGVGCEAGLQFAHTAESRKKLQLLLWELGSGNIKEIERRQRTRRFTKGPGEL